jgi:hypothetical protein
MSGSGGALAAFLAVGVAACGGNEAGDNQAKITESTPRTTTVQEATPLPSGATERVRFRASDGVALEGTLFGNGRTAVVLSHMGRGGDTQEDWYGTAAALAEHGFTALTYNRRGVCPGGSDSDDCSEGSDDLAASWQDVVGAAAYVESRGARRVVLVGASIGAMSSLFAAASGRVQTAGILEVGGINHASGYDFGRGEIARIEGAKIFASSRGDVYGGAVAARQWYRWASSPKRLVILAGAEHGTDMLAAGGPTARRLEGVILDFVTSLDR